MKMVFRQNIAVSSSDIKPRPSVTSSPSPIIKPIIAIEWNMVDRVLSGKPCVSCPRK